MGRDSSGSGDFEVPSQIAILRRAVAELVIAADAKPMARVAKELADLAALAAAILTDLPPVPPLQEDAVLREACSKAASGVEHVRGQLDASRSPARPRLESLRRKLHALLSMVGEELASGDISFPNSHSTELGRALSLRQLVSDFQSAIPWSASGGSSKGWALLVAHAELSILLKHASFAQGPEPQKRQLIALHQRLSRFRRRPDALALAKLHTELRDAAGVLASLSARPEVRRHDLSMLTELAGVLAQRRYDRAVVSCAVDILVVLRGLDPALDQLIVEFPFDPPRALRLIRERVSALRVRALAS